MNFASKATRTIAPLLILFFAIGCSTTPGSKDSKKSAQEDPTTLTSAEVFRDPDRMICRRERPTGSRISEKICMTARQWFDDYGVWVVFVAGFSPIPFKVFTIAAGVAALNLPGFFIGSLIGRAARFYLVAGLVRAGGQRFEDTLRTHVERIGWVVVGVTVIAIAYLMMRG